MIFNRRYGITKVQAYNGAEHEEDSHYRRVASFPGLSGRKLAEYDIEVVHGVNGLDGMLKIRSEIPDLIIMDYFLTRKSALEVLQEKLRNPNTKNVPVIMMATKLGSKHIMELAKFGVRKVFTKPLKLDALLNTLSGLLGISVTIDPTPSIIEAHFNEEILFIEVAQGSIQRRSFF